MTTAQVMRWQVWLADTDPPIWRRFQVHDQVTLETLHQVLQQVMGWQNTQPYRFEIRGDRYAPPTVSLENTLDSTTTTLASLDVQADARLSYLYDFRDGWLHLLTLEAVLPTTPSDSVPSCLAGELACPPEGCGGVWGYEDLLETLGDPDDPDYENLLNWVGVDFDPTAFHCAQVNQRLQNQGTRYP